MLAQPAGFLKPTARAPYKNEETSSMAFARSPLFRAATLAAAILAATGITGCTTAQQSAPPSASTSESAPSTSSQYITSLIESHVKAGRIPGAVMLVSQQGRI